MRLLRYLVDFICEPILRYFVILKLHSYIILFLYFCNNNIPEYMQ